MRPPAIVTTSWDDGNPSDLKIAELLSRRGLHGTFYVPIKGHHVSGRMSRAELASLAAMGLEIGAHGISQANLTLCTPEQLDYEVGGSKQQLEEELGQAVRMFAYPRGRYNREVVSAVREAGYWGARTCRMLARGMEFNRFRMPTSVQAYPHTARGYLRNLGRSFSIGRTTEFVMRLPASRSWVKLARAVFDKVLREGGVWHLYGHSWEVDEMQLWPDLDDVFAYVGGRPGVLYLPNSKVLGLLPQESFPPALADDISVY